MTTVIDRYELSPMQAGLLFHAVSGGDPGVYVQQTIIELHEPLHEAHFLRAWERVVERHSILRTRFRWEGLADPMQEVLDRVQIPLERFDLRAFGEGERQARFRSLLETDRVRGLNLGEAPIMRLRLVRVGESEYWALWTFHHALIDGRSSELLLREVFTLYESDLGGAQAELSEPRPYRHYIEWLRQIDHRPAKSHWQGLLSGFHAPTPLVVGRDPQARQVAGRTRDAREIRFAATLTAALKQRARSAGVALSTLVQGAWALLLHRYSGESDVVFGATLSTRRSTIPGADGILGMFINTLPVRVRFDVGDQLVPWLRRLREQQKALRGYEHTSLVDVHGWSEVSRGTPLFESIVVFGHQTLDAQLRALGGAWSKRHFHDLGQTNFPLAVFAYGDDELLLRIEYSRRRFDDVVIERMLGHLHTLLQAMAADAAVRLKDLPLLTEGERHQLLVAWNQTEMPDPACACVHSQIEEQVSRTPERTALVFEASELSYRALNERANRLAARLIDLGVGPEQRVGIHIARSTEMVVAVLAVLKAGGAYVPLDPGFPPARIRYTITDAGLTVLLTQKALRQQLGGSSAQIVLVDDGLLTDATLPASNPLTAATGENLAYVIYTSGSTGPPKGVMVEHRNVTNFFAAMDACISPDPPGTWLAVTSLSFDISVLELLWTLARGFKVVVQGSWANAAPRFSVAAQIERHGVSHLQCTPSLARMLLQDRATRAALARIRQMLVGGEALPAPLARDIKAAIGGELRNMYGPTETTVWSTTQPIVDTTCAVPIGRPIGNTQAYIVDGFGQPVPAGVAGELLIAGAGVTRGYLNRPDLTAARFLPNPFVPAANARLYRTGDVARFLPDGSIDLLGRVDRQVKIRGYRVELGEIEDLLTNHPAIGQAAVVVHESADGDLRLVAYVVPAATAATFTAKELREYLGRELPDAMIPGEFVTLDRMPYTPNGKLDRMALPAPALIRAAHAVFVAPKTPTEQALADLWQRILGIDRVGSEDHFFDCGGHSLLAMQLVARVRERFGVALPLKNLFERPTLGRLAEAIDALLWLDKCKAQAERSGEREETLL